MQTDVEATDRWAGVKGTAPRVLMLVTRNQRRGAESFAAALSAELVVRGLPVRLVSLAGDGTDPIAGMHTIGRGELSPRTLLRLRQEIKACDVVVACGSRTLPATALAGVGTGRPVVYQNIGDPLFWAGSLGRRLRVQAFLRRMAAVVALTEMSSAVITSRFGVSAGKVRVIHNARRSDVFRPATQEERARARSALGLPDNVSVVCLVGALSPEKCVDVAVDAVSKLPPDIRLVVAGEGPLRAELELRARENAPGKVTFLGQVSDLPSVLWASDVLLLTSTTEGVPGVLIEAGLCGLPVVSTEVGYVRDVVVPDGTGYLVANGDAPAVADALLRALAARDRLGDEARRHCVENFDLAHVSDQWAQLLRALGPVGTGAPR